MGPLTGLRVVEMAGLGPVPHAAMQLADMGADVIRVARPGPRTMAELAGPTDHVLRGRTSVAADLKSGDDQGDVLALVTAADVLIEGFRPGVMERLGLFPRTTTSSRHSTRPSGRGDRSFTSRGACTSTSRCRPISALIRKIWASSSGR